jgi:hypothetical protein
MRNQQRQKATLKQSLAMLLRVPRLYVQFVRYQPSMVGRAIALIPTLLLLLAVVLLLA